MATTKIPDLKTTAEAALILRTKPEMVRRLIRRKELGAKVLHGHYHVELDEILRYIREAPTDVKQVAS